MKNKIYFAVEKLDWHRKEHYLVSVSRNADPGQIDEVVFKSKRRNYRVYLVCIKRHTKVVNTEGVQRRGEWKADKVVKWVDE